MSTSMNLPAFLSPFFWDYDFDTLSWERQRDFIIRRLLQAGSWQALTWLRYELGDSELKRWLKDHNGAGLQPRQLRFWEIALSLPRSTVDQWVAKARQNPWGQRILS